MADWEYDLVYQTIRDTCKCGRPATVEVDVRSPKTYMTIHMCEKCFEARKPALLRFLGLIDKCPKCLRKNSEQHAEEEKKAIL